jgi:ATP-dependent exoDNAse (exonuclease V) beta subunit
MLPFIKLDFNEEKHVYFVDGKPLKASVSKLIKQFYKPFPTKQKAKEIALSCKNNGVLNKYSGMSEQEILDQWEEINLEATTRGTRVHEFGEFYPFNRSLKPRCKQEEAIKKFWDNMPDHIVPVTMELRMYHFEKMFAGTADIILFDTKKGSYIIADYKTNKDLFKNFRQKKLLKPFENLLDNPFNHYQLQLSYYQILLEQTGLQVSDRIIVYLTMEGEYEMYPTQDFTKELKKIIESYD